MSLNITNNNGKSQETFLKQLEGLAIARDILTANKLNKKTNSVIMNNHITCELTMTKKISLPKEAMQMLSNLEALKEATFRYFERNSKETLPNNISEIPVFREIKSDPVELSDSARKTIDRIGERARKAFINEQIKRADKYNIPYDPHTINYYELSKEIDQYEFLLEEIKEWDISWDIKIYDPVALRQELEECRAKYWGKVQLMRSDYFSSRGV